VIAGAASFGFGSGQLDECQRVVREVVRAHRASGLKGEAAIEEAAADLGMERRRVRGLLYGEVYALALAEYLGLRARYGAWLDHRAARLIAEAEILRARRAALSEAA
jgi:hypothetical protein